LRYPLDITSATKRDRLAAIVGGWIDQCAAKGFNAVDIDNLDTYARFSSRISKTDAIAYMTLLAARAHAKGLAMSHKNAAEVLPDLLAQNITDFVVNESCGQYNECNVFLSYGRPVLNVEYTNSAFNRSCNSYKTRMSIVRRDQNLVAKGRTGYVYKTCP
jgi:hypothetical protein